jgi:hypothetical protein
MSQNSGDVFVWAFAYLASSMSLQDTNFISTYALLLE